ncbi:MAG: hypothetical protein L0Y57_13255 [Beijerinckiaceae bacterium]|nr:hypothetical protein [Beijerinckiaceae bacterium]
MFFSRLGYLVLVFFVVGAFITGAAGAAYHLSSESTSIIFFLLWGALCAGFGNRLDTPEKRSKLFGVPMEYWGYGLIGFALLDAYLNWEKVAREWTASV